MRRTLEDKVRGRYRALTSSNMPNRVRELQKPRLEGVPILERKEYPEHSDRTDEEQAIHDLVIRKMAERLEETTGMNVLTNEGTGEGNGIEFDEESVIFPDIMCVEDEYIRYVCEV